MKRKSRRKRRSKFPIGGLVVLVLGVGLGVYLARAPWQDGIASREQARIDREKLKQVQGENLDMKKRIGQVQEPGGMESFALSKGLVPVEAAKKQAGGSPKSAANRP